MLSKMGTFLNVQPLLLIDYGFQYFHVEDLKIACNKVRATTEVSTNNIIISLAISGEM